MSLLESRGGGGTGSRRCLLRRGAPHFLARKIAELLFRRKTGGWTPLFHFVVRTAGGVRRSCNSTDSREVVLGNDVTTVLRLDMAALNYSSSGRMFKYFGLGVPRMASPFAVSFDETTSRSRAPRSKRKKALH